MATIQVNSKTLTQINKTRTILAVAIKFEI